MNQPRTPAPLPEILNVLESISAALRAADRDRSGELQSRAVELLRCRRLDCCERMILEKVLHRIRKAAGEASLVQDLESCVSAA